MNLEVLLDSYRRWFGEELVDREGGPEDWRRRLDAAPFAVVAHGAEPDPVLSFGNRKALELWEMDWEEFTRTPSRLTAEEPNREERARLLAQVSERGYIDDYSGIRVSKGGRRFRIEGARVWNVGDAAGRNWGQAAAFSRWSYL
ncbi:MAG: MEKHLA domain-containing protein [Deltaproteobacteria bacterium]|nr:MEKHLA domain-containing protein [Deltaproteobacteria bacterium]